MSDSERHLIKRLSLILPRLRRGKPIACAFCPELITELQEYRYRIGFPAAHESCYHARAFDLRERERAK